MRIKFDLLNFESECFKDLSENRGFLIADPPFSDVDKQIKNVDGPRLRRG